MTTNNRHILLLDDDYVSMEPLKEVLETKFGYQVDLTAAATLVEQLQKVRYDLLCVDIMIHPKSLDQAGNEVDNLHFNETNWQLTGLAFLKHFRNGEFSSTNSAGTSPQTPVIVLSAVAQNSVDEVTALGVANTRHIEKPFSLAQLIKTMNELMDAQQA